MGDQKYITIWIALTCILVFAFQLLIPNFTDIFSLNSNALIMPWQFVTSIFLHGSIVHIFYNLFALLIFGTILERIIGSKKFIFIFLVSGIIANIIAFNFYPSSLGASGAIMGIIGTLALLRPMMTVWAFNMPMPMFALAILWIIGSIMGIFGLGDPGTGHIAHLSGVIVGIIYGISLREIFRENKPHFQTRRVIIPENSIREWENYYMK